MNLSSAEQDIRAALKPKIPDKDFLTMSPGSVAVIAGVQCKLVSLNRRKRRLVFSFGEREQSEFGAKALARISPWGLELQLQPSFLTAILGVQCRLHRIDIRKGRWTFTPVSPVQVMPVAEMANPVISVKKK